MICQLYTAQDSEVQENLEAENDEILRGLNKVLDITKEKFSALPIGTIQNSPTISVVYAIFAIHFLT